MSPEKHESNIQVRLRKVACQFSAKGLREIWHHKVEDPELRK